MKSEIRIKVLAPFGADRTILDEKSWLTAEEGTTVRDVLHLIRCGRVRAKLLLVSVNGERVPLETVLHDGDVVGFFSPVTGG